MFKAIKNNKIIAINETGNFPCLVYDSIEQDAEYNASDYVQIDGEFVLTSDNKAIEQKQSEVRSIRDKMLDDFEWRISRNNDERELGIEETDERQSLLEYRAYLRDYTKEENWHEGNPLTFDSWLAKQKDMLQEGE